MSSNARALLNCSSAALIAAAMPTAAAASRSACGYIAILRGRTEIVSSVKVFLKKPYRSRTLGRGYISGDGTLVLSQHVFEEEASSRTAVAHAASRSGPLLRYDVRRGRVRASKRGRRQVSLPVQNERDLAVEQWVTPLPDGKTARTEVIVRRHGLRVARSEGTIRKL